MIDKTLKAQNVKLRKEIRQLKQNDTNTILEYIKSQNNELSALCEYISENNSCSDPTYTKQSLRYGFDIQTRCSFIMAILEKYFNERD